MLWKLQLFDNSGFLLPQTPFTIYHDKMFPQRQELLYLDCFLVFRVDQFINIVKEEINKNQEKLKVKKKCTTFYL